MDIITNTTKVTEVAEVAGTGMPKTSYKSGRAKVKRDSSLKNFHVDSTMATDTVKKAIINSQKKKNPLYKVLELVRDEYKCSPVEMGTVRFGDLMCPEVITKNKVALAIAVPESYQRNFCANAEFCHTFFATALVGGIIHGVISLSVHKDSKGCYASIMDGQQRITTLMGIMGMIEDNPLGEFVFNASKVSDASFSAEQLQFIRQYDGYTFAMLPEKLQENFTEMPAHVDVYAEIDEEEESNLYNRMNEHSNPMQKGETFKAKYFSQPLYKELDKIFYDKKYAEIIKALGTDKRMGAHMTFWESCAILLYKNVYGDANISLSMNNSTQVPVMFNTFRDKERKAEMYEFVAQVREIMDYIAETKITASLAGANFGKTKTSASKYSVRVLLMYCSDEENRNGDVNTFKEAIAKLYDSPAFAENFKSMYEGTTCRMWKIRMFAEIWKMYVTRYSSGKKIVIPFATLEQSIKKRWEKETAKFLRGTK